MNAADEYGAFRIVTRRIPDVESDMAEARIPDPTLIAQLQESMKGIDWAASLVKPW